MIAKEWRDARWKLVLGVFAFLLVAAVAPRPYDRVLAGVEKEMRMMEREVQRPVKLPPTEGSGEIERFERQMLQNLQNMREPGYPAKVAGWELQEVQRVADYAVLIPLAGLFGVVMVSPEVGQGSIYLLLSKPLSRGRIVLTKYAVSAASLFAVALFGAVGIVVAALAHGYPIETIPAGPIFASAVLIWLGSLFVLGVSLLASTIFKGIIPTILAAAAIVYLAHIGPDLVRSVIEGVFWTNSDYMRPWREMEAWHNAFETWRLSGYWGGPYPVYPFDDIRTVTMTRSFLVCLVTAVPPPLLALWLFRRKAY